MVLAILWVADLRSMVRGGGPETQILGELRFLLRSTLGLPEGALEWIGAVAVVAAAWQVVVLYRARDARWAFFAVTVFSVPVLALARPGHEYVTARYFVVCVPFFLVLLSLALCDVGRRWRGGRWIVAGTLALAVAASALPVARLLRDGRGRYREAIAFMEARTAGREVTVGGDNDFRNGKVLGFHAAHMDLAVPIRYQPAAEAAEAPAWYLLNRAESEPAAAPLLTGPRGRTYRYAATFPHAGLSGGTWVVYHLTDERSSSAL